MTVYTIDVAPLPLLPDAEGNELTNYIRSGLQVVLVGACYEIYTITKGYHFHFNMNNLGGGVPVVLPENVGYTYIQGHKLSKADVLRYYGGELLAEAHYSLSNNTTSTKLKRGAGTSLLRRIHNKRS